MGFMKQQIQKGSWLLIDGNCGTDVVPADLFSKPVMESFGHNSSEWRVEPDSEGFAALAALVADYTENSDIYSIELKRGFGARFSAPGFMDCTSWTLFDTEEQAQEYLNEEDDSDEEDEEELPDTIQCDSCQAAMINGVFCHETGCPNAKKTWIPEESQWARFFECRECGSMIREGESCDCQSPEEDSGEEPEEDSGEEESAS
jgi:hypothetical protein